MVIKKSLLLSSSIVVSLMVIASCGTTTPSPNYTPSETTAIIATPTKYIIPTPSATPTYFYTPPDAIKEQLEIAIQGFGRDIPIPHYLPEGYEITEALYVPKQQYSGGYVELTFTRQGKPDITMSIRWHIGPFRILPIFEIYQYFEFNDRNGTYGSVILGYLNDHNDLVWDWAPVPWDGPGMPQFYEMVLSASSEVPVEELVNIARFVRIT